MADTAATAASTPGSGPRWRYQDGAGVWREGTMVRYFDHGGIHTTIREEETSMIHTIRELAQEALDVQDAVNPSGVARSMYEAIQQLRENGVTATADLNAHPVTKMYAAKLASLTAMWTDDAAYHAAYQAARALAAGEVR